MEERGLKSQRATMHGSDMLESDPCLSSRAEGVSDERSNDRPG